MNILWVENHSRFAPLAIRTFLADYHVTVTPSLALARQALADGHFEFVLLDYDLDDGKGTELVSEIKNLTPLPVLIATSSHAFGNQALLHAGADAICSKMEFAKIQRVIAELMGKLDTGR